METDEFVEQVRGGAIRWPVQRGFDLADWEAAFQRVGDPSKADTQLYEDGRWFFGKCELVRQKLSEKDLSGISIEDRIRIICGIANHHYLLAGHESMSRLIKKTEKKGYHMVEDTLQLRSENSAGVETHIVGGLEGFIDGLRFPLRVFLSKEEPTDTTLGDDAPVPADFVVATALGEYYDRFEKYWSHCLWNKWSVVKEAEFDLIRCHPDAKTISHTVSLRRLQTLHLNESLAIQRWFGSKPPGLSELIKGRKKLSASGEIDDIDLEVQPYGKVNQVPPEVALRLRSSQIHLDFLLDTSMPEVAGMKMSDFLNAWELLSTLDDALTGLLPSLHEGEHDGHFMTMSELRGYASVVRRSELKRVLTATCGFDSHQSEAVLDFLTFKGGRQEDLWHKPLVRIDDDRVAPILMPLARPNLLWIMQRWANESGVDISSKGTYFEETAREQVQEVLDNSEMAVDATVYQEALIVEDPDAREKTEEIDFVYRLGNKILLGEVKCLIFPPDPLDVHNYYDELEHAAEQITRKTVLAEKNQSVFTELFSEPPEEGFSFVPFVLVNSALGAGYVADGVPVVDLRALRQYFGWGESRHLNHFAPGGTTPQPQKTISYYETDKEAVENIERFLHDLPQVRFLEQFLGVSTLPVSPLQDGDKVIAVQSLNVEMEGEKVKSVLEEWEPWE